MLNSRTRRKSLKNGVEILVRGTVQGVGFRPFVFKLASHFCISGNVINTSDGVLIQAIGSEIFSFIEALKSEAPPLARITEFTYKPRDEVLQDDSFTILSSLTTESARANIPPDISLCSDCFDELNDPENRRYRYPFINCTNCGPRFTIVETLPYDRPKTSMKCFAMCSMCESEYLDPYDRRFHAQPNACPVCGPQISYHDNRGNQIACQDVIDVAISDILDDRVLAVRGLGGFHLCVNGCSEQAVEILRARKNRPDKPLAIMVKDLDQAQCLCDISALEKKTLESPEHPIVLLSPKLTSVLAENLAPDMCHIGLMLPYTPLHHLFFNHPDCPEALVMTSGNSSGEPICTANEDARDRLASIADFFVLHNRDIVTRVDDSVVKQSGSQMCTFRRARGYAPEPIQIAATLPQLIACGGGLKSTFSLARDQSIFPSQHIGDLFNLSSYEFYQESIVNLMRLYEIKPIAAACDLHPDYLSSRFADELGLPLYKIQHHHAHAAAVMAEHGLNQPVLAIVMDGSGFGPDGTIWGGEILQADLTSFTRIGNLQPLELPGGDAAAQEPWRMALSMLHKIYAPSCLDSGFLNSIDVIKRTTIVQMIENGFNAPLTSSCGRLFDAVAGLLGINMVSNFEGQAAMQLESCARKALTKDWKDLLVEEMAAVDHYLRQENTQRWEIISSEFVNTLLDDISSGRSRSAIALQFHSWLISCLSRLVEKLSVITGIKDVVLSGGCMQNGLLLEGLLFTLTELGLRPYTGARIPINDGGISVGQAIIGGLQHVSSSTNEG